MILIKGFLKYKSSKIYIIIFTVMLLTISIIFNVFEYYSNLITNTYQENSYFLAISKNDIYNNIKDNKYINNIENVVLLEPNSSFFLESEDINETVLVDQGNSYIIVTSNQKQKVKLENNQIVIELPRFVLHNSNKALSLTGKKAYFKIENEEKEMEIIQTNEMKFARVIVPYEVFESLMSNNDYYAYTFTLNNYSKQEEILNYFETQDIQIDFIQFYDGEAQLNSIKALEKTINFLSYGCIVIIAVFIILFIIITCNIIHDEYERMHIERLLGYNKLQIKKYIIMKIVILNLIAMCFYTILYIVINLFI